MTSDNRKGNFVYGTNYGHQTYNERPPQRTVEPSLFRSDGSGLAGVKIVIRPTEQGHERQVFAEELAQSFANAGGEPTVQLGYSNHTSPFVGVVVCSAPNDAARSAAMRTVKALAAEGLQASIGEEMSGWGDLKAILLLVGENG